MSPAVVVMGWLLAAQAPAAPAAPCAVVRDVHVLTVDEDGETVPARAFLDGAPAGTLPGTLSLPFCGGALKVTAPGHRPVRVKLWEPAEELRLTLVHLDGAPAQPAHDDDAAPAAEEAPPPRPEHPAAKAITVGLLAGVPMAFLSAVVMLGAGAMIGVASLFLLLAGVPLWMPVVTALAAGAVVGTSAVALGGGTGLVITAVLLRRTAYWSETLESQAVMRFGPACMDSCMMGCMASSSGCCAPSGRTF